MLIALYSFLEELYFCYLTRTKTSLTDYMFQVWRDRSLQHLDYKSNEDHWTQTFEDSDLPQEYINEKKQSQEKQLWLF